MGLAHDGEEDDTSVTAKQGGNRGRRGERRRRKLSHGDDEDAVEL